MTRVPAGVSPLADPGERRTASRPRRRKPRGQSVVEFALILPVFMALLATTLDLGRLAAARLTLTNAAREGAFQASKTPTSFDPTQPCPSDGSSNLVVCRTQLEAKGSVISIAPSDIALSCNPPTCAQGMGNTVTVSVTGHFSLLTPLMAAFFNGNQNVTFGASSTVQLETLPIPSFTPPWASPSPSPTPDPNASPSPSPTPTDAACQVPSAGFAVSASEPDPNNYHAPLTITLTDTSTSKNCNIDSWLWTWGDGTTSMGPGQQTHSYLVKGDYTVTLKVSNAAGSNTTGALIFHVKP